MLPSAILAFLGVKTFFYPPKPKPEPTPAPPSAVTASTPAVASTLTVTPATAGATPQDNEPSAAAATTNTVAIESHVNTIATTSTPPTVVIANPVPVTEANSLLQPLPTPYSPYSDDQNNLRPTQTPTPTYTTTTTTPTAAHSSPPPSLTPTTVTKPNQSPRRDVQSSDFQRTSAPAQSLPMPSAVDSRLEEILPTPGCRTLLTLRFTTHTTRKFGDEGVEILSKRTELQV